MTALFTGEMLRRLALRLAIASLLLLNALGMFHVIQEMWSISAGAALEHVGVDWLNFHAAAGQIANGLSPYNVTTYRWTPTAAYLLIPLTALPWWAWQLAHVAGALALPGWRVRLLALVSYPWWYDVVTGNLMIFVVLSAAWALRGSRAGVGSFLALTLLIPRPLMIPIAVYLLARHRDWWLPTVAMAAVVALTTIASGFAADFLQRLVDSGNELSMWVNMAPSAYLGVVWVPIGILLAIVLFRFRRLGLASLALQPYWIPNYLLMILLELPEARERVRSAALE